MVKKITTSKTVNGAILGFEKTLFKSADKLRKNIDAGFKKKYQLKTNTALKIEAAKTEFKVI